MNLNQDQVAKNNLPTDIKDYPEIRHTIDCFIKKLAKEYKDEFTFQHICAFFKNLSYVSETEFGTWILDNGNNAHHVMVGKVGHIDYNLYKELSELMDTILYYLMLNNGGTLNKMIKEIKIKYLKI